MAVRSSLTVAIVLMILSLVWISIELEWWRSTSFVQQLVKQNGSVPNHGLLKTNLSVPLTHLRTANNVPSPTLVLIEIVYNRHAKERFGAYHRWIVDRMLAGVKLQITEEFFWNTNWSHNTPPHDLPVVNDSIVILNVGSTDPLEPAQYAAEVRRRGAVNVGLIVTNGECPWVATANTRPCPWRRALNHTLDTTCFDYTFRNYYWAPLWDFALAHNRPLTYWPLGAHTYAGPRITARSSQRRTYCYFSGGSAQGDRIEMINALKKAKLPCWLGLRYNRTYYEQMADSIFALTPFGNSPETWRFWEALENGAIPVMARIRDPNSDFVRLTGIPVIVIDSWSDIGGTISRFLPTSAAKQMQLPPSFNTSSSLYTYISQNASQLLEAPLYSGELDELQASVQLKYQTYVRQVQTETAAIIHKNFKRYHPEFEY